MIQKSLCTLLALIATSALGFGQTTYTWTGAVDDEWTEAGNWDVNGFPSSLSAANTGDDPDTVIFSGSNMPSSHASFGGSYNNDSATMIFNSGGEFTLDVSTSYASSFVSEVARTLLTVGDGVGDAETDTGADVTVNNVTHLLRHGSVDLDITVHSDGKLTINNNINGFSNVRTSSFTLEGGAVTIGGVVDTSYGNPSNSGIYFNQLGSSFTASYGGQYPDHASADIGWW